MHRPEIVAFVGALAVHAGIAYGLLHLPPPPPHGPKVVEIEVRPPPAPKVKSVTPPPPKPVEPPPKPKVIPIKHTAPPPTVQPPPNVEPPKEPPKDPPKPIFGVSMSSTAEGDSSMAVPVGNTTMIDPKKSGKGPVVPLPAASAIPAKPSYAPVSDVYIKSMPEIDNEDCGRKAQYPAEAQQLGIEGRVNLRVELDEKGHVHGIKVLSGLGHGLDEEAKYTLTHRCKFSPAVQTDGKAVPYVIQSYTFVFELPQ